MLFLTLNQLVFGTWSPLSRYMIWYNFWYCNFRWLTAVHCFELNTLNSVGHAWLQGLVVAGLADYARPADALSITQSAALAATGETEMALGLSSMFSSMRQLSYVNSEYCMQNNPASHRPCLSTLIWVLCCLITNHYFF